ncbi:MAG: OmpH family outer membrane protein [Salibacteraceae bacterium]
MTTNTSSLLFRSAALLGIGATLVVALLSYLDRPKTGYVNLAEVYENFSMKKELEQQLDQTLVLRKNILDSLKMDVEALGRQLEAQEAPADKDIAVFQARRNNFLQKEQRFREEESQIKAQYQEQIWTQLNQYIEQYGEENSYDFIHGADGSGSLMFAQKDHDLSKEIATYVNEKYKG